MGYQLSELITDVRRLLDEQAADESLLVNGLEGEPSGEPEGTVAEPEGTVTEPEGTETEGAEEVEEFDTDDTELEALIRGYAEEARNFVLKGCDASLLPEDLNKASVNAGVNSVSLSSCLRLVRVSCLTWKRDVSEFIEASSPDYVTITDPIAGGTAYSPRVGIRYGNTRSHVELTWYPPGYATVYYVSSVALTGEDLAIDGAVVRMALRHYLAGLVCQSLGDSRADNFFQLAMTYMGVSGGSKQE